MLASDLPAVRDGSEVVGHMAVELLGQPLSREERDPGCLDFKQSVIEFVDAHIADLMQGARHRR
ncbi:hypothetical protein D3C73_1467700 [compost metagenome]